MKKIILLILLIIAVAGCSNNSGVDNTVDSTLDNLKTEVTDDIELKESEIATTDSTTDDSDNAPVSKETQEIVPPVTKTESTLDNVAEKKRYLESLQYGYDIFSDEPEFQTALNIATEFWENELNDIYNLVKEKLSPQKRESFYNNQLAWTKFREREAGNPEIVGYLTSQELYIDSTKKRTLHLIDIYFDESSDMKYVTIIDTKGNLRKKPTKDSEIVFNGQMGDTFIYLQEKVDTADGRTWFKVEYGSSSIGYISYTVSNLTNDTPKFVRLLEDDAKFRSSPSINAEIISTGNKNEYFFYSDNERIVTTDGRIWLKIDNYPEKEVYISQKVAIMSHLANEEIYY